MSEVGAFRNRVLVSWKEGRYAKPLFASRNGSSTQFSFPCYEASIGTLQPTGLRKGAECCGRRRDLDVQNPRFIGEGLGIVHSK